ncbi:hypothetical protein [Comamonas testosteroni]|uniref:Uncharacterized protein n=1 Tax=Comamonas testosteroni TaxID=285 RepID=A0A096HR51_COMTE|nr:hypothetical protein [Comamonas testosteroni]KGH31437.1 hypothetical protein P353_05480 [Comamonas testosteroni]
MSMLYFLHDGLVRAFNDGDDPRWYEGMQPLTEQQAMEFASNTNPDSAAAACSPAQGLVALFAIKRITEDDVLAEIARIPNEVERYTVRIGYQRATTWERGSPAMQTMAQLLQLSESDLDELFAYAVGVAV